MGGDGGGAGGGLGLGMGVSVGAGTSSRRRREDGGVSRSLLTTSPVSSPRSTPLDWGSVADVEEDRDETVTVEEAVEVEVGEEDGGGSARSDGGSVRRGEADPPATVKIPKPPLSWVERGEPGGGGAPASAFASPPAASAGSLALTLARQMTPAVSSPKRTPGGSREL